MNKTKKLYEVREFVGNGYSRQLGRRLRSYVAARAVAKVLRKQGREIILHSFLIQGA